MPRKASREKIGLVLSVLQRHPGLRAGEYARLLGWHREAFNRLLVQLNDRRVLLSEDERGRIWLFKDAQAQ